MLDAHRLPHRRRSPRRLRPQRDPRGLPSILLIARPSGGGERTEQAGLGCGAGEQFADLKVAPRLESVQCPEGHRIHVAVREVSLIDAIEMLGQRMRIEQCGLLISSTESGGCVRIEIVGDRLIKPVKSGQLCEGMDGECTLAGGRCRGDRSRECVFDVGVFHEASYTPRSIQARQPQHTRPMDRPDDDRLSLSIMLQRHTIADRRMPGPRALLGEQDAASRQGNSGFGHRSGRYRVVAGDRNSVPGIHHDREPADRRRLLVGQRSVVPCPRLRYRQSSDLFR